MPRILLTSYMVEKCAEELRAIAAGAGTSIETVLFPDDGSSMPAEALAGVEMAFASPDIFEDGKTAWPFLEAIDNAPDLRWAHLGWAGIDSPRIGGLLENGIRLSNSPDAAAEPIAQSVIAGLLALDRRFPFFAAQQREHRWERIPQALVPRDLSEQTLVIFGYGAIGSEVARLAKPFGLHVVGVRRSPRNDDDIVDELVHPDDLDALLPLADWLAVAAPLTQQTLGAISAERLALLPNGAHVINIARGKIIDEAALTAALKSGALAGAYLDVFAEEPLPESSEFWDLPNVIVTPHSSWIALGNPERARQNFLDNLAAWLRGDPLPTEINER